MKVLNSIGRQAIRHVPYSRSLFRACELYCRRFETAGSEDNGDMTSNGELRLLKEVGNSIKVAFDVGANKGEWTANLLSVAPGVTCIHAFEPFRQSYDALSSRSFPKLVSLHRFGLSSRSGKAEIFSFEGRSALNSLHNRSGLENGWDIHPSSTTYEVDLQTIDEFRAEHGIAEVDFLKIDTEGHEVAVLEGAKSTLRENAVKIAQFEYGGAYIDSRTLLKDVFELVAPYNYKIFLINPNGLTAYPRYDQRLENFHYKNFVMFRQDALGLSRSAEDACRRLS